MPISLRFHGNGQKNWQAFLSRNLFLSGRNCFVSRKALGGTSGGNAENVLRCTAQACSLWALRSMKKREGSGESRERRERPENESNQSPAVQEPSRGFFLFLHPSRIFPGFCIHFNDITGIHKQRNLHHGSRFQGCGFCAPLRPITLHSRGSFLYL